MRKMRLHSKNIFLIIVLPFMLFSCASRKKIVYLQDIESAQSYQSPTTYEPTLQPDDLLSIIISAENPEVTVPFNLPQIQGNYEINNNQNGIKTYLIDSEGVIEFPVLGKIKLGGLTRSEANKKLTMLVSEYVKNPGINLRILNYKISVLGEVSKPGSYTIPSERITVLEALGLAGDLSVYGKRNNILVIHEEDGKRTFNRIDITNAAFLNSPSYYLSQNDIVVVEPNKTKINASVIGPNTSVILTGLTVLITLLIFFK
ncbi:MAG: polysaccharide biosynthesis/export family protein [Burkholderiales bacterium]|nr:polysaccharide biosynthesis/export family protein [Flavobacterium sp.]